MTNLEAIQSVVAGYPLSENTFTKALIDRGIPATTAYSGSSQAFELATADIFMILATAANITEGGYQVSMTDKSRLKEKADAIYAKYTTAVSAPAPATNTISDATSAW